jgi:hypothetical protein
MNTIEAAQKALTDGCQLLRPRKEQNTTDSFGKLIPQYDLKEAFTGKKKGWFYLDSFTASAIMACYNALSDENKAKAPRLTIGQWASFAFNHVK